MTTVENTEFVVPPTPRSTLREARLRESSEMFPQTIPINVNATPHSVPQPEPQEATTSGAPSPRRSTRSRRSATANSDFCCVAKEYYSEYSNLVDTLHIAPRLMIQRRCLRKNSTYGLTLSIRNNGLYPRLIDVRTDSPSDTTLTIANYERNRFLGTDKVLTVNISIRSKTERKINRTRHIFIDSFHPNITFQVPIMVIRDLKEPIVCEYIKFLKTVPNDKTYFEMIIYNPDKNPVRVKYRSSFKGLKLNFLGVEKILSKDYTKVLLSFKAAKLQEYKGFFNVKFGLNPPRLVIFDFTPKSMSAYVSRGYLSFGHAKFTDSFTHSLTICNESTHQLDLNMEFYARSVSPSSSDPSIVPNQRLSTQLFEDAVSMHSVLLFDFDEKKPDADLVLNEDAKIHFYVDAPPSVDPMSSGEINVTFHPAFNNESTIAPEELEPPYLQRTKVNLCFSDLDECIETHYLILEGEVDGIEVEVSPKVIDFRRIYLGEEHCAFIKFLNVDVVNAMVRYRSCQEAENCAVRITPIEGFLLNPCERCMFHLSFYTLLPTGFNVTLHFKVDNGGVYTVWVKGSGTHVQLRTFPQLVEFGSIPFAVPQKRFMLLMNPLAVPITLQVQPSDDGEEQPLVFNIHEPTKILPITIKDPIKDLQFAKEDMMADLDLESPVELTEVEPESQSFKSYSVNESVYSADFEESVLEPIPAMATQLLTTLKQQKIFDKTETDKRVIHEALAALLNINYFNIFNKHNNFIFMDWHAIPSDPKEIYCDNEIIYLRPNTGRSITILIIPNKLGYFRRSLTVRICPALPQTCSDSSDDQHFKSLIKSEYMCSKLWFEYNCIAPEIDWQNYIDLTDRTIYAGEEYNFDMEFVNISNIGGFLHFDVIPNEMSFHDGVWKYYIAARSRAIANCLITFRVLGKNKLSGLIKIVGDPHPYPFHLFGRVLPTEIRIKPSFVHKRIQVFQEDKIHFYIDNYSPTNTKLMMWLKNIDHQYLTTRGGMLAPTGQSMYTTMVSMFTDPDLYQNMMYIDLQFDHMMKIPITFLVEGVPLWFTPDIKNEGFDAGKLFTDLKEEFEANLFKNRFPVKVTNKGKRIYRITISRLKTYNPDLKSSACANQPLTARFEMMPKLLELHPESEEYLEILISGYEEGTFYCDFMLTITDTTYPQRKQVIKVTIKATFVECQLTWDRKQLTFNYQPSEPLKERSHILIAKLININNQRVDKVFLEAAGPFRIKAMYEHSFVGQLVLSLDRLEERDIFVLLNKAMVKQLYCRHVEGRVAVMAEGIVQDHLILRLEVQVPEMQIVQPELVLFDRGQPYNYDIEIVNNGCSKADYKWKRVEVSETFVGPDDSADLVADVLSEILRTLEYNFTCDEEPNLTLRYQQCRCQFHRETETGSLILDIIDEIINELDLTHRRFIIRKYDEDAILDDSEMYTSSSFVRHTIDNILDRLNIESSQELSVASSEYCFSDRFIYFYEKTGLLEKLNTDICPLHLPHVKRSHEMKTLFCLEVVGGRSQYLSVTLVNLAQKIKFQKDNIYVNIKPWYETYTAIFRITNVTNYPLHIMVMPLKIEDKEKLLIDGYGKLMQEDAIYMDPQSVDKIKVSGILGFNENFVRVFAMVINESAHSYFRLRGQGILPILSVTTPPLPKLEQSFADIVEEYLFLRIIYNYEIFKSITDYDKEPGGNLEEEDEQETQGTLDFSVLSESEEEMSNARQQYHDMQFFQMMKTYVQVNNNQELPNATVLDQMIVTERYLQQLRIHPALYVIHKKVYQSYVNLQHPSSPLRVGNVKHFIVQPLPCEHLAYVLDLGTLCRNTLRRFELRLHFFGPGKLIACARTAVRIPGLYVDFRVDNHTDKKFTYWAEKCTAPEFFNTGYRNMWERLVDSSSPRVKHAHSFDLDSLLKHNREITDKDRRQIEEYYNSLNPSVYADHLHHFTLAKILTTHHSNFSDVELRLVGLFKPQSKYYEVDQRVVDYIYIDLHMGPTLPIMLRGVIK